MEKPENFDELSKNEQMLLIVTENGFGKRTSAYEFRTTSRGAQGVRTITLSDKIGPVVSVFPVKESDEVMLMTNLGKMIRCPVCDVRITSRSGQGVIMFRLEKGEKVVSAVRIADMEDNA